PYVLPPLVTVQVLPLRQHGERFSVESPCRRRRCQMVSWRIPRPLGSAGNIYVVSLAINKKIRLLIIS
ncbi:hypothetical protein, partial [Mesorhizobium sp. M7A.F.Ca.CA.001.10.2.1]|uniref:hypothetical protein n=1 Tax=Mesorhizobium sp. M7A.F.Ca.CA.001.10.2.1 TaxID=2496720 RepID=UPI0019CFF5BD